MPRTAALTVLIWAATAATALAVVHQSILVEPESPTVGEVVTVHASGYMPDGCWDPSYTASCSREGNLITIRFETFDRWLPGSVCTLVVQSFSTSCEVGPLEPGQYTVMVVEEPSSLRTVEPRTHVGTFSVSNSVDVSPRSWTSLKALFEG